MLARSIYLIVAIMGMMCLGMNVRPLVEKKDPCLVGARFPDLNGTSLKGDLIDPSFFEGHITLVSFWRIGCMPSMWEIPEYNALLDSITDSRFQIISIAPHTHEELLAFYGGDTTHIIVQIREALGSTVPKYDVLPMCTKRKYADPSEIGIQCNSIKKIFGIEAYPQTLIVGPDGFIRHRHDGLLLNAEQRANIRPFVHQLDSLLRVI